MRLTSSNGIMSRQSRHSADETLGRLTSALKANRVTVFAVIDHSGEAIRVGLKMPPTKLVVAGNPQAGTPLMLSAPSVALDLPVRILIAEDVKGQTSVAWDSAEYLQRRHGFDRGLVRNLAALEGLIAEATA